MSLPSLEGISLLQELPAQELGQLTKRMRWRRVGAREIVLSHLDRSTDVFFVIEGHLRAEVFSLSGRQVAFREFRSGQCFGELAAIDGRSRSASIVAISDSIVASLPAGEFRELLRRYPEVAAHLLADLAVLVRQLSERVFEFSTLAVRNRLHAEILRLAQSAEQDRGDLLIRPMPTHAEIASRISTHREAVTRELNALAQAGLIEQRRGALAIRDLPELRRIVNEVTGLPSEDVII